MTPANTTKWVGDFGENVVRGILESRGYRAVALQNASGQGIDVVAVKHKYGRSMLLVGEVKSTGGVRAPSLSTVQGKNLGEWARSRLVAVREAAGRFRKMAPADRALAREILELIDEGGIPAASVVVKVKGVGAGPPTVEFGGTTHVPRVGVTPSAVRRARRRGRLRP
ncbi:hypothetical protein ACL02T_26835 [Pseudonocardia sp. RS010]|uniref:hypothetical protein n=1 Tax=Pseudonocardia sp. RS010 TaxID=3385979 RepID=UPI00399F538B